MSEDIPEALAGSSEIGQLHHLGALLAAIARKAATRFGDEPAAIEMLELATKAEALVAEMVRTSAN